MRRARWTGRPGRVHALAWGVAGLAACAGSGPVAPRPPSAASAGETTAGETWGEARAAARAARERGDHAAYLRQLEALYARSGSVWVLRDLAHASAALGDRSGAVERLGAIARAGVSIGIDDDPAFAPWKGDPALGAIRDQLAANASPVAHARVLLPLPHEDLLPEDIAYDAPSRTLFVGSVRHRKILAIDERGAIRDFVAEGTGALLSVSGLAVTGDRLWVTSSTLPPMVGFDPAAPAVTALVAFALRGGNLLTRVEPPQDGHPHLFTDLTATRDGTLLVADDGTPMLYALAPGETKLRPLFPDGELVSPQTAAESADGRLLVPDYVRGIAVLDRGTRAVAWMGHADTVTLTGIDGLYADRDGTLVAVQNGVEPPRVVRLVLDAAGNTAVRADVLERATPGLGEPTHGVLIDGAFVFVANAGWPRFDEKGGVVAGAPPDAPALWRLAR